MLLVVTFKKPRGFPAGRGCVTHILRPKNQEMAHAGHFLLALSPALVLTAFGGGFSLVLLKKVLAAEIIMGELYQEKKDKS